MKVLIMIFIVTTNKGTLIVEASHKQIKICNRYGNRVTLIQWGNVYLVFLEGVSRVRAFITVSLQT